MASTDSPSLQQLFAQLKHFGDEGDYSKADAIIKKILKESPQDKDALLCRLCCLIQQGKYDNALNFIKTNRDTLSGVDLTFQEAYCYYRSHKTKAALELLQSQSNPSDKCKELLAQVLYRLENYKECITLYRNLIKNSQDEFENERETNLAAACALLNINDRNLREDTYELRYNAACNLLSGGQVTKAINKLNEAEELCRRSYDDDADITEEEIEDELGVVRVQLGFAHQLNQNNTEALRLYNQVLKTKPSDSTLAAVASNNVITINKDKDLFDSKKKIKALSVEGLHGKLTLSQLKSMEFNKCLLHIYANQSEQFQEAVKHIVKSYNMHETANILRAFRSVKEKNIDSAISTLEGAIKESSDITEKGFLTLAQLYLMQDNKQMAIKTLKKIKDNHRLGIIATLVALLTSSGDTDSASKLMDEAIDHWYNKAQGSELPPQLFVALKENANLKLRLGRHEEAISSLESLRKSSPNDVRILSQLITAYSKFNSEKAELLSKELPDVETEIDIDVDSLEIAQHLYSARQAKRMVKVGIDSGNNDLKPIIVRKKRKSRKKKAKLPKNCDPNKNPDPERWIPRRERSYYKKKKKAPIGKGGSQGSTASSAGFDASTVAAAAASQSKPATVPETNKQPDNKPAPPQLAKKPVKKAGKKKKGKW